MRQLYTFYLCQIIFSTVLLGSRPIVSLYSHSLGANEAIIGLLVSVFAFIPMIFAIRIGKWLDVFGARKLTILGGLGMGLAFVFPVIFQTISSLFVSQAIIGISHLAVLVSLQKTVGNHPGDRDKLMATFSLCGSLGDLMGPLISGYIFQYLGVQYYFGLAIILVLIAVLLANTVRNEKWSTRTSSSQQTNSKQESTWKLLKHKNLRKAVIVSGLVLYSKDLFVAYFPVYGSQIGLSASEIGVLLSIMATAAFTVRAVQFNLVQKFGRGKVILFTLFISGVSFILIPFATQQILLGILVIMLGAGLGLGQPISLVYALNASPVDRQGEVLGLRLTFNRGSQFVAPFIFGSVGTLFGLSPVFWLSGLVLIIGAKYTRMKKEDAYIHESIQKNSAEYK